MVLLVKEGIGGEREGDIMDNVDVHVLPTQFEQLFLLLSLLIITLGMWYIEAIGSPKLSKTLSHVTHVVPMASASNPQPNLTCNIRLTCPFLHLINQFQLGSWITLAPITWYSLVCSLEWLHMPHHHCQMMC